MSINEINKLMNRIDCNMVHAARPTSICWGTDDGRSLCAVIVASKQAGSNRHGKALLKVSVYSVERIAYRIDIDADCPRRNKRSVFTIQSISMNLSRRSRKEKSILAVDRQILRTKSGHANTIPAIDIGTVNT